MKRIEEFVREMLQWGTPQCGILCGITGIVLAVFLLTIGFWKTLFVTALFFVGLFIGAVKDKQAFIKNLINKLFPPKQN